MLSRSARSPQPTDRSQRLIEPLNADITPPAASLSVPTPTRCADIIPGVQGPPSLAPSGVSSFSTHSQTFDRPGSGASLELEYLDATKGQRDGWAQLCKAEIWNLETAAFERINSQMEESFNRIESEVTRSVLEHLDVARLATVNDIVDVRKAIGLQQDQLSQLETLQRVYSEEQVCRCAEIAAIATRFESEKKSSMASNSAMQGFSSECAGFKSRLERLESALGCVLPARVDAVVAEVGTLAVRFEEFEAAASASKCQCGYSSDRVIYPVEAAPRTVTDDESTRVTVEAYQQKMDLDVASLKNDVADLSAKMITLQSTCERESPEQIESIRRDLERLTQDISDERHDRCRALTDVSRLTDNVARAASETIHRSEKQFVDLLEAYKEQRQSPTPGTLFAGSDQVARLLGEMEAELRIEFDARTRLVNTEMRNDVLLEVSVRLAEAEARFRAIEAKIDDQRCAASDRNGQVEVTAPRRVSAPVDMLRHPRGTTVSTTTTDSSVSRYISRDWRQGGLAVERGSPRSISVNNRETRARDVARWAHVIDAGPSVGNDTRSSLEEVTVGQRDEPPNAAMNADMVNKTYSLDPSLSSMSDAAIGHSGLQLAERNGGKTHASGSENCNAPGPVARQILSPGPSAQKIQSPGPLARKVQTVQHATFFKGRQSQANSTLSRVQPAQAVPRNSRLESSSSPMRSVRASSCSSSNPMHNDAKGKADCNNFPSPVQQCLWRPIGRFVSGPSPKGLQVAEHSSAAVVRAIIR